MGVFAIRAMIASSHAEAATGVAAPRFALGEVLRGALVPFLHPITTLQSTLIGMMIGALPGPGATLALGIPGSTSTAILMTLMGSRGVWVGPLRFAQQPLLAFTVVGAFLASIPVMIVAGIAFAAVFGRLGRLNAASLLRIDRASLDDTATVMRFQATLRSLYP